MIWRTFALQKPEFILLLLLRRLAFVVIDCLLHDDSLLIESRTFRFVRSRLIALDSLAPDEAALHLIEPGEDLGFDRFDLEEHAETLLKVAHKLL